MDFSLGELELYLIFLRKSLSQLWRWQTRGQYLTVTFVFFCLNYSSRFYFCYDYILRMVKGFGLETV